MICIKSLHLRLNRVLLLAVGLWPYERSKLVQWQLIFFYAILVSFITFQCTTFMTSKYTSQFITEILSNVTFFLFFSIKYNMFSFNMDAMKHLMDILQRTYDELRDENEVAIIERYGIIAKRFTNFLTLFSVCGVSIFILTQTWPQIHNILSANKSRVHPKTLIRTEYFVDQEKYFYLITLHSCVAMCIGTCVTLATGTMIITYFQYTCGMFTIARFMNLLMSKLNMSYLVLAVISLTCLSLNLFRIYQEISAGYNIENMMLPIIISITNYIYIFLANGCSQQVMDCSDNVYSTVYNVQWYLTPLHIQKMILFLLQRGSKAFVLDVGGMFVGSLESAAKLTSYSISYFTVLYSMQ